MKEQLCLRCKKRKAVKENFCNECLGIAQNNIKKDSIGKIDHCEIKGLDNELGDSTFENIKITVTEIGNKKNV